MGTVIEIVYGEDENPNDGSFPQYVIVDFSQYCDGPLWMIEYPTWVPIPPLKLPCLNHCCQIKYIPLSLAWAKTGHTSQ
jgi:hypothetical protein